MEYELKKIKRFNTRNGRIFEALLYKGDKKIGDVEEKDDGSSAWLHKEVGITEKDIIEFVAWHKEVVGLHWTSKFLSEDKTDFTNAVSFIIDITEATLDSKNKILFLVDEDELFTQSLMMKGTTISDTVALKQIYRDYPKALVFDPTVQNFLRISEFGFEKVVS